MTDPRPAIIAELTATLHVPGTSEVSRRRLGAIVVTHGERRMRFEPAPGSRRLVGGRSHSSDIVVDDPSVSAAHFELLLDDEKVVLRDLGSRNGTRIGTTRIYAAPLEVGATFFAGSVAFVLERADEIEVVTAREPAFGDLRGECPRMRELFALSRRVARTSLDVLIHGETGTGKELLARALHAESERAGGPFCVLDCASLPRELAEAAIRGHVKGSFTGAQQDRPSCFEDADGGTLFLDEVGELPLELQPKLLRVLDRREVSRIGETRVRPIDVRVVSATHRDLRAMAADGSFREDLYHRLGQCAIELPPLRERGDDVLMFARGFLEEFSKGYETARQLSVGAMEKLAAHEWRGNVRELRNVMKRAAQLATGAVVERSDLAIVGAGKSVARGASAPGQLEDVREQCDREYLRELLAFTDSNVTEAARIANVSRRGLQKMIERLGLSIR